MASLGNTDTVGTCWNARRFRLLDRRLDDDTRRTFLSDDRSGDGRWALLESLAIDSMMRQFERYLASQPH